MARYDPHAACERGKRLLEQQSKVNQDKLGGKKVYKTPPQISKEKLEEMEGGLKYTSMEKDPRYAEKNKENN